MDKLFKNLQQNVYPLLPVSLQNIGISVYGYWWYKKRFGSDFHKNVLRFKEREFYNPAQWNQYQLEKLKTLLIHCFNNVEYYKYKYKEAGFSKKDFENFRWEHYKHLPFLEKEDLRKFGKTELMSKVISNGSFISSSGSTGTPVNIYLPNYFHQFISALMEARVRNWAGVNYKTSRGMIGGRRVIHNSDITYPLYRYNFIEKQTYFSAYHLSKETVENYLEGMIKNNIRYLTGYAKSIHLLASFLEECNFKAPMLDAVITSSEKLELNMRETISNVFSCKVYDSYSGCEGCGYISETPEGALVFSPDSGILEVLDERGNDVQLGQVGEVVLTGLHNLDQPLIRYRIGDNVILAKEQGPVGGRYMPVIEDITGRLEDVIVGKDGRKMVRFHSIFYNIEGLKLSQVEQIDLHLLQLNLVVDNNYNKLESEKILTERIISQIGKIHIRYHYPKELEKTNNGKLRAVISHLK